MLQNLGGLNYVRGLLILLALAVFIGWATFVSYSEGFSVNGSAAAPSLVPQAELSLTNVAAPSGAVPTSSQIIYTIKINNAGPDPATNVSVNDPIPAGTTFSSFTTTQGSCTAPAAGSSSPPLNCSIGSITAGSSAIITLTVNVTALPGATISNISSVITDTFDPTPNDHSATATNSVAGCDLSVTNTNDTGAHSLRLAIQCTNANPGLDTITFNISGAGVQTIQPLSALPGIADPVIIDGYTQSGASANTLTNGDNAILRIEMNGNAAGNVSGLTIGPNGGGSTIKGLVINRFNGAAANGISINSAGTHVEGNVIGTEASGTSALPNGSSGVSINSSASNTTVGGTVSGARNVISGNTVAGVSIFNSPGNSVQGNLIGTKANGTDPLPNSIGVSINGSSNSTIGGAAGAANIIRANNAGVSVNGDVNGNVTGIHINGNTSINGGTNSNGVAIQAPNISAIDINNNGVIQGGDSGISINANNQNGAASVNGVSINGNTSITGGAGGNFHNAVGVSASGTSNPTTINNITVNNNGTISTGTIGTGVNINSPANTNVSVNGNTSITGNFGVGVNGPNQVNLSNTNISVSNNQTITGGPNGSGVSMGSSTASVTQTTLKINGNTAIYGGSRGVGIGTQASSGAITSNQTDIEIMDNGSIKADASNGQAIAVGGCSAGGCNSANSNFKINHNGFAGGVQGTNRGIQISSFGSNSTVTYSDISVTNNTVVAGSTTGGSRGISLLAISTSGHPNVISGNDVSGAAEVGIMIVAPNKGTTVGPNNNVHNNHIGVGSQVAGLIGTGATITGNSIHDNDSIGLAVIADSASGNVGIRISQNSIFSNGGLGIDLGNDGVTANDACDSDTGANALQNAPILTSVSTANGTTSIQGTLNSNANKTFTIEFFANAVADASGFGEGQTYIGSTTVTTDGNCNATFSFTTAALSGQPIITATATDANAGNTSEFSQAGAISFGISTITPNTGGDTGVATVVIRGGAIAPGVKVKLVRAGQRDIVGTSVSVSAAGTTINASFDLTGKALGSWDVVATNFGGATATIPNGFTIEGGRPPEVWADILGRTKIRAGVVTTFSMVYGNRGNVDAPATMLRLYVPPGLSVVEPLTLPDGTRPVISTASDGTTSVLFFVQSIGAGTTTSVPISLKGFAATASPQRLRVSALSSPALQPDIAMNFDPTASASPTVIESSDTNFKMMVHVATSQVSGDINVQTTISDTTVTQPFSINVTKTDDLVHYTIIKTVANSPTTRARLEKITGKHIPDGGLLNISTNIIFAEGTLGQLGLKDSAEAISKLGLELSMLNDLVGQGLLGGNAADSLKDIAKAESVAALIDKLINGDLADIVAAQLTKDLSKEAQAEFEARLQKELDEILNSIEKTKADLLRSACQNIKVITYESRTTPADCTPPPVELTEQDEDVTVVDSHDPNEKSGTQGAGPQQYIPGIDPLRYIVSFENQASATAPAQTVVVSDQLDPAKVDLTTFNLGMVSFGNTQVAVPSGLSTFVTDVDLRPANNLIVRIDAHLDATGLVTWRFTSIDPATGKPTTDPLAGFLPPDKKSPEGQGAVAFSVNAKSNLQTGTQILNKATIVFDANAAIDTPQWLNTIDNKKPNSSVQPLAGTQTSVIFPVKWSGSDADSGVQDWTIYVSENGGPFSLWQSNLTTTSAMFVGKPATSYAFYTIARDGAGNVENDKTTAEANTSTMSTPTSTTNSVDDVRFFIRQQYLDFLNRAPDQTGWDFWVNTIESCGADASCREVKRINASGAFFLSIEFQQTGFLVERTYKAAFGDATGTSTINGAHQVAVPIVRLNEFLPDNQQISQGVVVNQGTWQQQLENNKQAFMIAFVQRPRFTTAFPVSMTPSEFVGKLNTNTGNVMTAAERAAAIAEFGSAGDTSDAAARARALRRAAECAGLSQASGPEFNRAFVLMEYFGYLRRNPNDPPDTDYSGYDFWLMKLGKFNGNIANAEMVKAFIASGEFRSRFGQP